MKNISSAKDKILFWVWASLFSLILPFNAQATPPVIDSFNLQSYIRLSNGQPVAATSGNFVFAVFKGISCVWAKRYTGIAINLGMVNQKISGNGSAIASINNPTATAGECVADYSLTTLNSTLLASGSAGALSIRVYTETSVDGYRPIWDVVIASSPLAMIADYANVAETANLANDVIASKKAASSAGAGDAGKFVILNGSGKIDNTLINTAGMTFTSSQVSGLGTAATVNTGTASGNVPILNGSAKLATSVMPTYSANKVLTTDGTGVITAALNTTNSSAGAGDAGKAVLLNASGRVDNTMIDSSTLTPSLSNVTGTLSVAQGGTGATSLNSGELLIGNGAGAIHSLAPSTAGNILVSNGSTWASSTANSANLVTLNSAQTITGAKTLSGNTTLSGVTTVTGALAVGAGAGSFSKILPCSIASTGQTSNAEVSDTCTGATAASAVICSPTVSPASSWVIASARADTDAIAVKTLRTTGFSTWNTAFTCVVFVP